MVLLQIFYARLKAVPVAAAFALLFSAPAAASSVYWNLFNLEGESSESARYVTYGSASDMLNDTNRTGDFVPGAFGRNIIGSGAMVLPDTIPPVPVPAAVWLFGTALLGLMGFTRRRKIV